MKREFLKAFELDDAVIDQIMDESIKDIEREKGKATTAITERNTLQTQLADVQEQLKAFEGVDVAELQGKITALNKDLSDKDTEYQSKIADMTFSGSLTAAISALNGKSAKAISAMLDVDGLRASKNQEADIKTALEALKESDGYLFEQAKTPPHYAAGTGNEKIAPTEKEQIMQAAKTAMQIK